MDITELRRAKKIDYNKRHPWEQSRARIISFLVKKHSKARFPDIVDIGAGDGYMGWYFTTNGLSAHFSSIDTAYTSELLSSIKNNIGSDKISFYPSLNKFTGKQPENTDVVLVLDVLEHIDDPGTLLSDALSGNSGLEKATWIITVPAYNSVFSLHDKLLGHKRRYTAASVSSLLESYGFVITGTGYFFFTLLLVRILHRLLEKAGMRSAKKSIDNWNNSSFVSRILVLVLWWDFSVGYFFNKMGIRIPGLSCYVICQPKN
jgi:hypothetical protein